MSAPAGGAPEAGRGGGPGPAVACDLHLSRCSPLCDALGALAWGRPIAWFHDFGLLPLDRGLLLRLGVTSPSGPLGQIKALTAGLWVPGVGVIGTQDFPLAPYVHRERTAAHAIVLCEQDGRFRFVRGAEQVPLAGAELRCLARVCRAIETWAALLSGGGLPGFAADPAGYPAAPAVPTPDAPAPDDDQEQLVVIDEAQEPMGAP